MPTYSIPLKEAPGWVDNKLRIAIREGALRGLYSAALRMVQEVQVRIIPKLVPVPTQRGIYKAGWKAGRTSDGAWYGNSTPYAGIVEYGVPAGRVKVGAAMIAALTEWVLIKGFAAGLAEAKHVAWAVATRMAANLTVDGQRRAGGGQGIFKGTGLRVMEKANERIVKIAEEEVAREVERALGGA